MGLLQFANLGLPTRFEQAQRSVYNGLGDLYRYLNTVRRHLVRSEAIRRIEWRPSEPPEWARPAPDEPKRDAGAWVALVDRRHEGSPDQLEETRAAFLDERTREVYERSPADDSARAQQDDSDPRDPRSGRPARPPSFQMAPRSAAPGSSITTPAPGFCCSTASRRWMAAGPSSPSVRTRTRSTGRSRRSSGSRTHQRLPIVHSSTCCCRTRMSPGRRWTWRPSRPGGCSPTRRGPAPPHNATSSARPGPLRDPRGPFAPSRWSRGRPQTRAGPHFAILEGPPAGRPRRSASGAADGRGRQTRAPVRFDPRRRRQRARAADGQA